MRKLIVTNQPDLLPGEISGVEMLSPKQYISHGSSAPRNTRVFNLCSDYSYQSKGYYVSLLAEARGHKPIPDVKNLQDAKTTSIVRSMTDDLDKNIQQHLKKLKSSEFVLSVYFGQNIAVQYERLSHELHRIFPMPMFRARFTKSDKWVLQSIHAIGLNDVPKNHRDFIKRAASEYFDRKRYYRNKDEVSKFDLAILVNQDEMAPPSNKRALEKFKDIAERSDFFVEFITREDAPRLNEFDALFIRATTRVNHYTYRMARKAESEGLAVIDDPSSILKCANKVYLAELLRNARIPMPKTMIIHSDNRKEVITQLGLPCILKLPDSSFSIGVIKVKTEDELQIKLQEMLNESDLVIGQEYAPTDFDWRVGVLDGKAIYACKYFMAKGHWQIYNWSSKKDVEGKFETSHVSEAPKPVIELAEKASRLIGTGLYGVDIKDLNGTPVVIEINDNPNIDAGVEDQVTGDAIYQGIIDYLKAKIFQRIGISKSE